MKEWLRDFQVVKLFEDRGNEEAIKKDFDYLNKIFTSNSQTGQYGKDLFLTFNHQRILGDKEWDSFAVAVASGDINIYKYSFDRPIEPTIDEIQEMNKLGKCSVERTMLLYWWANCFAKSKGLRIEKGYNSYLSIDDIFTRCGEVTGDSLYSFMIGNSDEYNKLLIFPFLDSKGQDIHKTIGSIDCYLIEFTWEYLSELNKREKEQLQQIYNKIGTRGLFEGKTN